MGNRYSVAREEQEEDEFYRLIEAVEIAQQRSTPHDDVELGMRSHLNPPTIVPPVPEIIDLNAKDGGEPTSKQESTIAVQPPLFVSFSPRQVIHDDYDRTPASLPQETVGRVRSENDHEIIRNDSAPPFIDFSLSRDDSPPDSSIMEYPGPHTPPAPYYDDRSRRDCPRNRRRFSSISPPLPRSRSRTYSYPVYSPRTPSPPLPITLDPNSAESRVERGRLPYRRTLRRSSVISHNRTSVGTDKMPSLPRSRSLSRSVDSYRSRSPTRSREPHITVVMPSRSPRDERDSRISQAIAKFERILELHEKCLTDYERRTQLSHEQSMAQSSKIVRRFEQYLISRGTGGAMASAELLSLSDVDDKIDSLKEKDTENAHTTQIRSPGHTERPAVKSYPHRPYAAGLHTPVRRCSDDWRPVWDVFPLKAFRGSSYMYLKISADWDDAALLKELGRSYDKLRTVWRKWFSLRSVRSITMVYADHTCVYPRRIGLAAVSSSKNMRLRYFLRHPEQMKGRHEFMQVLTARTDLGIEFVEGWQLTRIAIAILLPVIASLMVAVFYSVFVGDVSDAFTIAGYMTSAYSVCLVLLGLLNFVEF